MNMEASLSKGVSLWHFPAYQDPKTYKAVHFALIFQAWFDAVKSLLNYSTKVSSPTSASQMDSTPNKKVYYPHFPLKTVDF